MHTAVRTSHINKSLGAMSDKEFMNQQSERQLLRKDSAPGGDRQIRCI
jgi:hypothetical protein